MTEFQFIAASGKYSRMGASGLTHVNQQAGFNSVVPLD